MRVLFLSILATLFSTPSFSQGMWSSSQPFRPGNVNHVTVVQGVSYYGEGPSNGDRLFLDVASGNITTEDIGDTFTVSGTPTYQQAGTGDLFYIERGTSGIFTSSTPNGRWKPGSSDFSLVIQFKGNYTIGGVDYVFDFDSDSVGMHVAFTSQTAFRFVITDGTFTHAIAYSHGSDLLDGTDHTAIIRCNRSAVAATLEFDGVSVSVTASNDDLNTLGAVSPSGTIKLFARESDNGLAYDGGLSQVIIEKNLTYVLPRYP